MTFRARSVPWFNVHVGSSNEMWRYNRSELRPPHSDSKYDNEGKEENFCYDLV